MNFPPLIGGKWGPIGELDGWLIWVDLEDKALWACTPSNSDECSRPRHHLSNHPGLVVRWGTIWCKTPEQASIKLLKWITTKGKKELAKLEGTDNAEATLRGLRNFITISGGTI